MKAIQAALALGVSLCTAPLIARAQAADVPPTWAYAVNPPDFKVKPDDGTTRHVPGGTSVAAPVWAGIVNTAGGFSVSSQTELNTIYANHRTTDIIAGSCGPNQGYLAGLGWDFCTGLGSPLGEGGK